MEMMALRPCAHSRDNEANDSTEQGGSDTPIRFSNEMSRICLVSGRICHPSDANLDQFDSVVPFAPDSSDYSSILSILNPWRANTPGINRNKIR